MNNQTNASGSFLSLELKCFLGTISTITSVNTVLGNLLVLVSFYVERKLRTSSNYLIASLAVTDVIIGALSMNVYMAYLLLGVWPFGKFICDLWLSLDYSVCLVSQYTVLMITVDRFCSVKMPARYHSWRTETKIRIIICIIWAIPMVVFFVIIMAWSEVSGLKTLRHPDECYAEFARSPLFNILFTIGYFWITLIVMIWMYFAIYLVALNLERKSDEKKEKIFKFVELKSANIVEATMEQSPIENEIDTIRRNSQNSSNSSIFHSALNSLSSFESFYTAKMMQIETNVKKPMVDNEVSISEITIPKKRFPDFIGRVILKRTNSKPHSSLSPIVQSMEVSNTSNSSLNDRNKQREKGNRQNNLVVHNLSYQSTTIRQSKSLRARKALRTITLIIGAFLIAWTPYHILILIKSVCDDPLSNYSCVNETLYSFSYLLCYLNSPINPFCYALADKQFKITFKKILHLRKNKLYSPCFFIIIYYYFMYAGMVWNFYLQPVNVLTWIL